VSGIALKHRAQQGGEPAASEQAAVKAGEAGELLIGTPGVGRKVSASAATETTLPGLQLPTTYFGCRRRRERAGRGDRSHLERFAPEPI
jgi:hypothetical protein